MNLIYIEQPNCHLIFEKFKIAELIIVQINERYEVYVNIESNFQTEEEIKFIEEKYQTNLSEFMKYTSCRLQFMNLNKIEVNFIFNNVVTIDKGWENENNMTGIYVGWGVETFNNQINMKIEGEFVELKWNCSVNDLDRYDLESILYEVKIDAKLEIKRFDNKQKYWEYEKLKLEKVLGNRENKN